jgi:hypothetical protein
MTQIDPADDLVSFLQSNINASNISVSFTPSDDVKHANYEGSNDYPQIAIVSNDPVVPGGGETGFTAIRSGNGPVQDSIEALLVDCWGGSPDDGTYQDNSDDPDATAAELRAEVVDTCNSNATNPPRGYQWMSGTNQGDADDTDRSPTHYREQVLVRMKQTKTF